MSWLAARAKSRARSPTVAEDREETTITTDAEATDPAEGGGPPFADRALDYSPWTFWTDADDRQQARQRALQRSMITSGRAERLGSDCFLSELASVANDELSLGDRTYVAAGAYLTGELRAGRDCTINPYAVIRGRVRLGDAVRIGAHSSLLGFNHTMSDPDTEVFRQSISTKGITVGDDVWIGSHAVVLDGVVIGDRSVIAAGAVVTKDVPAGSVVAGNPARVLRWRVPALAPSPAAGSHPALGERLTTFADRARREATDILARCWDGDAQLFVDRPGAAVTVRAPCDAIEVADLLLGRAPDQLPVADQIQRLRGWQDRDSGLVAPLAADGAEFDAEPSLGDADTAYHVLCVGYALDLLGSELDVPVRAVSELTAADLVAALESLPWQRNAWLAGHVVDTYGTALLWNRQRGELGQPGAQEALFGWLTTRASSDTGMWGRSSRTDGLLQVVNGFYRASRGTFAQFDVPIPHPERVIDTVLTHVADPRYFRAEAHNACNVLDVAHPLWLTRHTGYRADDVAAVARRLLAAALDRWVPGQGFGFRAAGPDTGGVAETVPGLQGTEMWLAVIWLLADLLGLADQLGYRPRGIHRPEAADRLTSHALTSQAPTSHAKDS